MNEANVSFGVSITTGILDIHLFWAGKGTCCIPVEGTYGPLLSAIQIIPGVSYLSNHHFPLFLGRRTE